MKLDFLSLGGGGGGSGGTPRFDLFAPRHDIDPPALDDATRVIRVGLIAGGLFFGLLLLFSVLAPISGAAVATGEVTTSGTTIVIQPTATGVVSDVYVHEGQAVKAGQSLVRLNGVASGAAAEQAQAKHDALRALQARLIAERDAKDAIAFPPDLANRMANRNVQAAVAAQTAIFRRNHDILLADRAMAATDTDSAQAQQTGAQRQRQLIDEQLVDIRKLYAKGYARKSQVLALEQADAQFQAQGSTASSAVAKSNIQQTRLASDQIMQIVSQLEQVDEQLAQVDPALRVTRYDADRDLLRAPVAGKVSGIIPIGPGTVLGAGNTVMQLVPAGRMLIVEAQIDPKDIDDVHVGSAASLQFSTVHPGGERSFNGKVVTLSPMRVAAANGVTYYRAQLAITDPDRLRRDGVTLQPGLPVAVHVTTHARSLLSYLFEPIRNAAGGAFRQD